MFQFRKFASIFTVQSDDPDLTISQFRSVSRQMMLLYPLLMVNCLTLALTHYNSAHLWLTVVAPILLIGIGFSRIHAWKRAAREPMSPDKALILLRRANMLAPLLAVVFLTWALAIYPYGDSFDKAFVAFFIAFTVVPCIFCLMHLRSAALMVTIAVGVPSTVFFALTRQPIMIAISANFLFVALGMVVVLIRYYRDFISLSDSKKEVIARQIETQRLSDENFRLANVDTLTNLLNRRGFFRGLESSLNQEPATPLRVTVGLIDLDGFKPINDIFGHKIGDAVLQEVGRRVAACATPSVSFARLGGDEFGFILQGGLDCEIMDFANALCLSLRAPYVMPTATAVISASIGMAVYPRAGRIAEQLFERADYALYYAKQNQRGTAVMFSYIHQSAIREAAGLEQALRHADLDAELCVAFQPIFNSDLGRTVAFECLARWDSPELGRVQPMAFIKAAERSDLINRVTEVLLRKSLESALEWPDHLRMSFNLSVRDIASEAAVCKIGEIIIASGINPSRIDFEITETAVMHDFDQAREALLKLKALGVQISLDDFGTGYSSLSYVHRLPFDKIKVDRSFTADIETDVACINIIKTVLDLCRNLKLRCIVEGLETPAQVRILKSLGCSLMQGYFFARPMPAESVAAFLDNEAGLYEYEARAVS